MTIPVAVIVWILAAHYVADFLLQSDWMAQGKSKAWTPLLVHVGIYTAALGMFTLSPLWAAVNGVAHLAIDYFTSRASSRLFKSKRVHWAFAVIGFDQLLHTSLLVATWDVM